MRNTGRLLLSKGKRSGLIGRGVYGLSDASQRRPTVLLSFKGRLRNNLRVMANVPTSRRPITIQVHLNRSMDRTVYSVSKIGNTSGSRTVHSFAVHLP